MKKKAYIIFTLDDQRYALSVKSVKNIIRSVALTYLTEAPDLVFGLLNIGGTFIPVINIREQFALPQKSIQVSDRIIIAEASSYTVAFIADSVEDVMELAQEPLDQSVDIFPGMEKYFVGISKHNNATVLIYDINTLFPEQMVKHITDKLNQIEAPV